MGRRAYSDYDYFVFCSIGEGIGVHRWGRGEPWERSFENPHLALKHLGGCFFLKDRHDCWFLLLFFLLVSLPIVVVIQFGQRNLKGFRSTGCYCGGGGEGCWWGFESR